MRWYAKIIIGAGVVGGLLSSRINHTDVVEYRIGERYDMHIRYDLTKSQDRMVDITNSLKKDSLENIDTIIGEYYSSMLKKYSVTEP